MFRFSVVLILWGVLCIGCHDNCKVNTTRCNGNATEVCNTDGDWDLTTACDSILPVELDWTCCLDPADSLHSCLPKTECESFTYDGGV